MKYYEFKIHSYEIGTFFSALRKKEDVISVLMGAIKSMLIQAPQTHIDSERKIVIRIDNMSRIFFISERKIYTLAFPFSVCQKENGYLEFSSDLIGEIDSQIATGVLNIARTVRDAGLLDLGVTIDEQSMPYQNLWEIFKFLMLYEDGYIRFDHDPDREDGHVHPLNHLDIFYENRSTFKLGLREIADLELLTDMLDRESSCHYLNRV